MIDLPDYTGKIDIAHRLKTDPQSNRVPAIIVRFNNRSDRNLFYSNIFSLKEKNVTNLGYQEDNATASPNLKIFINESLSVHTKYLYKLARDHCKKIGFRNCYTSSWYVRKEKDSYRYIINKEEDLLNIKEFLELLTSLILLIFYLFDIMLVNMYIISPSLTCPALNQPHSDGF